MWGFQRMQLKHAVREGHATMGAFCGRGHFDRTVDSVTGAIREHDRGVIARHVVRVSDTMCDLVCSISAIV